MKRACLLIVVPALLSALGFAQTPTASSNTDSTSIKGCLGGAASNYTLVEDNTGHNFKITATSVDLKPHLGHDVTLIGQKATAGAADGSFVVTSLNMISEHCAAAAAAPAGSISTPADTAIPPPAAAAVPAATIPAPTDTTSAPAAASAVPAATVATPPEPAVTSAVAAAAPAATVPPAADTASAPAPTASVAPSTTSPAEPVVTPNVAVPAAAATVQTPADTASAPPSATITADATARTDAVVVPNAATTHRTRMPIDHERAKATAAAAAPPAETATPVADAAKPPAADNAPSATAVTPDAAVAPSAVAAKKGFPGLWIAMAVAVLILGTLVPLINRWRKRRLLAQSDKQNLSFSHRATSESGNADKPVTPRKAA
jgi:hypothetical protein